MVVGPRDTPPGPPPRPVRSWRNLFRKKGSVQLPSLTGFLWKRKTQKENTEKMGQPKSFGSIALNKSQMMLFQREPTEGGDMVGYGMEAVKEHGSVLPPEHKNQGRCPVCTLPLPCGISHPPKPKKGIFGRSKSKGKNTKDGAVPTFGSSSAAAHALKSRPRIRVRSDSSSEDEDDTEGEEESPNTRRKHNRKTSKHHKKTKVLLLPNTGKQIKQKHRNGKEPVGNSGHESGSGSNSSDTEYDSDREQGGPILAKEGKDVVGRDNVSAAQLEKINRAFNIFDRGKVGHIGKDQVMGVMRELGQPCKDVAELEEFYGWADTDESGRISIDEFINMLVVKVGYRSALGVHFIVDSLKGFTMPSVAERNAMHNLAAASIKRPKKKKSTLTSRNPNKGSFKTMDLPPTITARMAGGGAGFAPLETILYIKPKKPHKAKGKAPVRNRVRSWGMVSDQGDIDKSWGEHEQDGKILHGSEKSPSTKMQQFKKEKGRMNKYEHKDFFVECPDPCTRMLEIELIGDLHSFRLDGRQIRDVVGSCRVDMTHLKLLPGEKSKMIIVDVYKPRPRGDVGDIREENAENGETHVAPKQESTQNERGSVKKESSAKQIVKSGTPPKSSDPQELFHGGFDENAFVEPSHHIVGHLMLHLGRGLLERSRELEKKEDEKEVPWDLQANLDDSTNAFIYDECISVLDTLVHEHEADKAGTRDDADPCQLDAIWEKMDWQNLGIVALGKIEKFIINDFAAMVDHEILMCVYQCVNGNRAATVDEPAPAATRRSWVQVTDLLEILCCQLNFKRIYTALEDVPKSPLALDEPPPLNEIRVDKRQFAYLLKRCAMTMMQQELDDMWHLSSPDDDNTILLSVGCRLATQKRFWPTRYLESVQQTHSTTGHDYRAKLQKMQRRQRQKSALADARKELGRNDSDDDDDDGSKLPSARPTKVKGAHSSHAGGRGGGKVRGGKGGGGKSGGGKGGGKRGNRT